MKKVIAIILILACLCIGACGKVTNESTTEKQLSTSEAGNTAITASDDEMKIENSNDTSELASENQYEPFLSFQDVLKSFGGEIGNSFTDFYVSHGMEAHGSDMMVQINDTLGLVYPKDGLYVLNKHALDEDELEKSKAGSIVSLLGSETILVFPKKYDFENAEYYGYLYSESDFAEKGTNLTSLIKSDDKRLGEIISHHIKESFGTDEYSIAEYNGIEYAYCMGQTSNVFGGIYITVQNGELFEFYIYTSENTNSEQEATDFADYIMKSIFPYTVTLEKLETVDNTVDEESEKYWKFMEESVPEQDRKANFCDSLELWYPSEQFNVYAFMKREYPDSEPEEMSRDELDGWMGMISADAIVYPKRYSLNGKGYCCYVRIIPGYFEKGKDFHDLKGSNDKKLLRLIEKYDLSGSQEINGIEYADGYINTVKNGLVYLQLTVANGNLVIMEYTFSGDCIEEALAFSGYLLHSIHRIEKLDEEPRQEDQVNETEDSSPVENSVDDYAPARTGDEIPVTLNGIDIMLGRMTLQEIVDKLGITIKESSKGIVVNKEDTELVEIDTGDDDRMLCLDVENRDGTMARDALDCIVTGLNYTDYAFNGEIDSLVNVGGITLGSKEEDVTAVFGDPSDTYNSDDSEYKALQYDIGSYYISFVMLEGNIVDDITVLIFEE